MFVKFSNPAGVLGVHSLTVRRVTGDVHLFAVIPKNSAYYALNMINLGMSGASLYNRDSRSSHYSRKIANLNTTFAPKLVIEQWGYTDIGDAADPLTSIASTIGLYGIEIDRWQALSVPIICVSPSPWVDVNLYRDDAS